MESALPDSSDTRVADSRGEVSRQVQRALAGDRSAEEWLARRSYEAAVRLATFALHDLQLAQDVGQEVAIRVVRALAKLREPERFDGWVYRISAREIKRAAKKRGRALHQPYEEASDQAVEANLDGDLANREWLVEALAGLTERQRIAVGLRYVHDLPDEEIARVLRCRRGTVRSLLSRGLSKMREHSEVLE